MSSSSVRMHAPVDLHQHEPPPGESGREAIPVSCDDCGPGGDIAASGRLWREDGRVMYQDAATEPVAVRLVWARPLSGREGPVSVLQAGKKKEIAYLPSLDLLDSESRAIAREELAAGMILPRITAIHQVKSRFGNYYFDVDTDLGRRKFLLSSPENNTFRPGPGVVVIKDVSGNCFEISPISGLSRASLRELERVL